MASPAQPARISFEDFLVRYEGALAEWVDGNVLEMSPVSIRHQQILRFLLVCMAQYVEDLGLGGEVLSEPALMKIGQTARSPDLMYVSASNLERIKRTHIEGAADVCFEIVSPGGHASDRGEKFVEYEAAGVREYWIVDPTRNVLELYVLGDEGRFTAIPPDERGRLRSTVIEGFWLEQAMLWSEKLPRVAEFLERLKTSGH